MRIVLIKFGFFELRSHRASLSPHFHKLSTGSLYSTNAGDTRIGVRVVCSSFGCMHPHPHGMYTLTYGHTASHMLLYWCRVLLALNTKLCRRTDSP